VLIRYGGRKVAAPCMAMCSGSLTFLYADHLTSTTNSNGARQQAEVAPCPHPYIASADICGIICVE
jgi:hypothetical protein